MFAGKRGTRLSSAAAVANGGGAANSPGVFRNGQRAAGGDTRAPGARLSSAAAVAKGEDAANSPGVFRDGQRAAGGDTRAPGARALLRQDGVDAFGFREGKLVLIECYEIFDTQFHGSGHMP